MEEIRVYDRDLNWIGVPSTIMYLQFTRELYGIGSFEMKAAVTAKNWKLLGTYENVFIIGGDVKKCGVIKSCVRVQGEEEYLQVTGYTADCFLKKRVIVPPADGSNYGYSVCEGMAETVIKHFVSSNMKDTYNTARDIENFEVAEDTNFGVTGIAWRARYSQLSDEVQSIGEYVEIGYHILPDINNRKWVFDIIRGEDKTDPVVFRVEYNNVSGFTLTEDGLEYANVGYLGGSGEDENQLVYAMNDAEYSGMDREEVYIDCSSAENITELKMYGEQELAEYKKKTNLELNAYNSTFIFDEDYYLGDTVRVLIDRGAIDLNIIVTSITETWEDGYTFDVTLGEDIEDIKKLLKGD